MNKFIKIAATVALTGALAAAATTESFARNGRNAAAAAGFVGGLAVGAAVANSNSGYYGPGYGYGPSYGYYDDSYAYAPAPVYVEPSYGYSYGYAPRTNTRKGYGYSNLGIGGVN